MSKKMIYQITIPTLSSDLQMLLYITIMSVILSIIFFREIRVNFITTELGILIAICSSQELMLPWTYSLMILLFGVTAFRIYVKNKNQSNL